MQKRNLAKIKALMSEWGKWRRSEDSLRALGYKAPQLIPATSAAGSFYAPESMLVVIDEALTVMREQQFEGYDLLRERYYYQQSLKDCGARYGITESKASLILDGLLSWLDGHTYSRLQSEPPQTA